VFFGWYSVVAPLECSRSCAVAVKCKEDFEYFPVLIDAVVCSFAESPDSAKQVDAREYVRRYFLYAEHAVLQEDLNIRRGWGLDASAL